MHVTYRDVPSCELLQGDLSTCHEAWNICRRTFNSLELLHIEWICLGTVPVHLRLPMLFASQPVCPHFPGLGVDREGQSVEGLRPGAVQDAQQGEIEA